MRNLLTSQQALTSSRKPDRHYAQYAQSDHSRRWKINGHFLVEVFREVQMTDLLLHLGLFTFDKLLELYKNGNNTVLYM